MPCAYLASNPMTGPVARFLSMLTTDGKADPPMIALRGDLCAG